MHWLEAAKARKQAVNKYLWNPDKGMFFDYDFTTGQQSTYVYATIFYPLWAGLATKEQAAAVDKNLALLDRPGGLASSTYESGLQWDLPFGWAPLNWFAAPRPVGEWVQQRCAQDCPRVHSHGPHELREGRDDP